MLVAVGLVAALSGVWMASFYAIVPADHLLLHLFRLLAGGGMAVSLVLGYAAIRQGDVEIHQRWMRRAYAIGQGAGTQAITQMPLILLFGPLRAMPLALAMGARLAHQSRASPSGSSAGGGEAVRGGARRGERVNFQTGETMRITASGLYRLAGLAAVIAGLSFAIVGVFHPPNVLASVTTPTWLIVHVFALAPVLLRKFRPDRSLRPPGRTNGMARVSSATSCSPFGWRLILGSTFVEVFILPVMATASPAFVEGFVGMFTGSPSTIDLRGLPTVWAISGPLYILGGLVFGVATFRAGVLPRWAGALLALGTLLGPAAILFPPQYVGVVAVPVGLALAWLGYALWSERRPSM